MLESSVAQAQSDCKVVLDVVKVHVLRRSIPARDERAQSTYNNDLRTSLDPRLTTAPSSSRSTPTASGCTSSTSAAASAATVTETTL
jgi:mevalonate pyrophosphate decarboxylase